MSQWIKQGRSEESEQKRYKSEQKRIARHCFKKEGLNQQIQDVTRFLTGHLCSVSRACVTMVSTSTPCHVDLQLNAEPARRIWFSTTCKNASTSAKSDLFDPWERNNCARKLYL